jgi:glycosyltransferase involved in cell wall biosynthesis
MRIALTLLSGVGYGGKTYFSNLLPALTRLDTKNDYTLFVPHHHALMEVLHAPNVHFVPCVPEQTSALQRLHFEQRELPRLLAEQRIDVLFTAKNLAVFRAPCAQVISIRNMEPFRYRHFKNALMLNAQSRVKWELTKRSIRRADGIVAVSQAVRDEVVKHNPHVASRVSVVYNGNPVRLSSPSNVEVSVRPFLLTASKFVAYANQLRLVEGYAALRARMPNAPDLWFAGGVHDRAYAHRVKRRITELQLESHIRLLGLVPQDQLHDMMRVCTAFIFPSQLESCPHTLIEAMACGAPVAASSTPPMPEIGGDAATYFDADDPQSIARQIAALLSDRHLRARGIERGHLMAQMFSWEHTARGLVDVFSHVHHMKQVSQVVAPIS